MSSIYKVDNMINYREIMRLRSLGYSITHIAAAVHSSRNNVRDVQRRADQHGLVMPVDDDVTNKMLYEQLYPERSNRVHVWMEPDCEWIHNELPGKGVNLTLLWEEYKVKALNSGKVPYQYSQFCKKYRSWTQKTKATMRIHHKPGDPLEVDWAGATLPITDPVSGEISEAYLFVGVLPCSCYAYAELFDNMRYTEASSISIVS